MNGTLLAALAISLIGAGGRAPELRQPRTRVSIVGSAFYINGKPTYAGRTWRGRRIEGLLMNARMVQGIFDDLNPATRSYWAYPDTGVWDPERNTREFVAAMPEWRRNGLLAFSLNLQGGSPRAGAGAHPWHNSAFTGEGDLRPEYMARLERILNRADELGMVVILGLFYFGQDQRLRDEAAVLHGVDRAVDWALDRGYANVLIEINNECNVRYDHAILQPDRVHELIARAQGRRRGSRRLLVGTSYGGGTIPGEKVLRVSDFVLMHGNNVGDPERLADMVRQTRSRQSYRPMPILFTEDDHFDFDRPANNMLAAISQYASWGCFDAGRNDYEAGYQSPPVRWGINTPDKRGFFSLLREITGGSRGSRPATSPTPPLPMPTWTRVAPESVGLDDASLAAFAVLVGGRGCVVRHGLMAYSWGDIARSSDVASAVKPLISLLMLLAVQEGLIADPDSPVAVFVPALRGLNGGKDGAITWRHLGSQTSGYGRAEAPGDAYAYNDLALALYYDTLMDRVFGMAGEEVLRSRIAAPLGFEDPYGFNALGRADRRGRLSISVRDFARIGLLCLRDGLWGDARVLPAGLVGRALSSVVPPRVPRTSGREADMLPDQRSLGGGKDQTPSGPGWYSYNWWVNGKDRSGQRLIPEAPKDLYFASGHGGKRALLVIPSRDIVVSWNDSSIADPAFDPHAANGGFNRAVRLLLDADREGSRPQAARSSEW